tara:strand:+ start:465 stop:989 length:525 start_codon:yes stop_codon:yes gene_type:complete
MRKSIFSFLIVFFCLTTTVQAVTSYPDENHDYQNDATYQAIASDFREYTVCGAIHDNLTMLVAVNYGVGANLGYPTEYLQRMQELLANIKLQKEMFEGKSQLVIKKLINDYNFPLDGLLEQMRRNQVQTQQSIGLVLAQGKENPAMIANVVKGLLEKSQSCRNHISTVDYSNIE